ncbi:MAG: substrate-binding domain-containing protein [Proteobacteria bacterium]|nr:substrate-binding domain-containing protein [Pseudomonadota bacterium]MDA0951101.1 substrate-binding domain-containing protein [Pseudomonadota bacterium]MDA1072357.1 substrate-binding domain-containing protein [Pseudomonadota bacterium]
MNQLLKSAALASAAMALVVGAAQARDQIQIVGSSTVFPYTQAVAENFANMTGMASPVVESTGTGGGMQIFCEGVGEGAADITGASRAMKASEYELCQANGVTSITEVLIGYDGLSFASSRNGTQMDVTKAQLFQALANEVEVDGEIVENPYTMWNEIDPSLPAIAIQVFGPPPTSGTRDAWVELVMEEGCEEFPAIEALDKDRKKEVCQRMRSDGPFIEAGENDNLIVQRLESDSTAYGIFGYSFLYENSDKLVGSMVGGVSPSFETIADGSYAISRPLYFYIKNAHRGVIPGLDEFVAEYVSEAAMSSDGYLNERGLVALADDKRAAVQDAALNGTEMAAPQ